MQKRHCNLFNRLHLAELREICREKGLDTSDCFDKQDFVDKLMSGTYLFFFFPVFVFVF
jgi:hypothetical protein